MAQSRPADFGRDGEAQGVIGAAGPDELIGWEEPARAPAPIPAERFSGRAAAPPFRRSAAPRTGAQSRRSLEAAVEIDRGDQRLADIGEDRRGCAAAPAAASARDRSRWRPSPIVSATRASASRRTRCVRRRVRCPSGSLVEAPPQEIGDDEAQHPVAEKFETLIAALGGLSAAPAATMLGCERARMGQRFVEKFGPGESVPDLPASRSLRETTAHDARSGASTHAVEQPAVADRERPFPDFPTARRAVGREEDELRLARPGSRPAHSRQPTIPGCPASCRDCRPS